MRKRVEDRAALALAVLAVAAAVTTPAGAQQQPPAGEAGVFAEVIEVRVINLEVVVTDRQGNRVTGLAPDQFRLLVDGNEVPIEFFTEIRSGVAMEQPGVELGMELAPGTSVGEPVGTSYLVFIDEFFSIARDRDIVVDSVIEDLASMGPRDRVAVVAFDGHSLDMLSSWSESPEEVREVLRAAKERPTRGLSRIAERQRFDESDEVVRLVEDLRGDSSEVFVETYLSPEERFYASMLADQVRRAVQGAAATLRSFASPPGRKVMLLASGGWPFLPADFVVSDFHRPTFDSSVPGGGELFRPLTETANRLGYTIYAIDVPGFDRTVVDASTTISEPGFSRRGSTGSRDALPSLGREAAFLREQEAHYSLEFIAEQTGGKALINSARRNALATAREDTRSYYWLGFTPTWQGDDSYHEVRVEVGDPELRVRNRSGFLDLSRSQETTMQVESSLLFGTPTSAELLSLSIGRPEKAGFRKMEVPVTIRIPVEDVIFLPTAQGGQQARLEIRIAVIDSRGGQAEIPVMPLFIDAADRPDPGEVFSYPVQLKMRRERHRVVVAVYDQASGKMMSGTAEISP